MTREGFRIISVQEITTGHDETMGIALCQGRIYSGLSVREMADAAGLSDDDVHALEQGRISCFPDIGELRKILLAYCDQLALDPGPFITRLEAYERRQLLLPPLAPSFFDTLSQRLSSLLPSFRRRISSAIGLFR